MESAALMLLQMSLQAAVPLHALALQGTPWMTLQSQAENCAQMIAEHGDHILYRSKKSGETAKAFNALARAVAILSFAPGGVQVFGLHFENTHSDASQRP